MRRITFVAFIMLFPLLALPGAARGFGPQVHSGYEERAFTLRLTPVCVPLPNPNGQWDLAVGLMDAATDGRSQLNWYPQFSRTSEILTFRLHVVGVTGTFQAGEAVDDDGGSGLFSGVVIAVGAGYIDVHSPWASTTWAAIPAGEPIRGRTSDATATLGDPSITANTNSIGFAAHLVEDPAGAWLPDNRLTFMGALHPNNSDGFVGLATVPFANPSSSYSGGQIGAVVINNGSDNGWSIMFNRIDDPSGFDKLLIFRDAGSDPGGPFAPQEGDPVTACGEDPQPELGQIMVVVVTGHMKP